MKKVIIGMMACAMGVFSSLAHAQKSKDYLNYAQGKPVLSSVQKKASLVTDGLVPTHQWRAKATGKAQWIGVDMTADFEIHAAHIYFDLGNLTPLSHWELQYRHNGKWKTIPGTKMTKNYKGAVEQRFEKPVNADAIRLITENESTFGVDEIQLWGKDIPKLPYGIKNAKDEKPFVAKKHWVCANQVAYNINAPKWFTVPTAEGKRLPFYVIDQTTGKTVFRGRLRDNKGDFTKFEPTVKGHEYVIKVKGGKLKEGSSYPFSVGHRAIQTMSYPPAVAFMNDARSMVGTHPSAYGGTPWRDGTYYTYELPSMALVYLSDPAFFQQMPRELSWEADSARVMSPDYKKVRVPKDRDVLHAVRSYYTLLPKPKHDKVPDIVQNMRFTAGWILIDPITQDPSGGNDGERMHAQTVEQLAYFLYAYPAMKQYISEDFYKLVYDATFRWWKQVGLLDVITTIGTGKGRDCPGHSIMPNLFMYEVAKRANRADAEEYMNAAIKQTQWIIDNLDWNNPTHTKGQRISEHKLPTALVHFYLNYPEQCPKGLKDKLTALGQRYVSTADNMWDFRRYDMEMNWTIPGFNECGNVIAFPACALGVAMCVDDAELKARLEQLAFSHFDATFGRNPMNAHAANHPEKAFVGVDNGFPYRYHDDVCARLELCRGSLSSLPGTEMYPFNPEGKNRWPEGWTAYNAAWNVALAYLNFYEQPGSITVLKEPTNSDFYANVKLGDKLDLSKHTLTFNDEFDGHSLDLTKWAYRTDVKHRSVQLRENVHIGKGLLRLDLHRLDKKFRGKMATGAGIITRDRFKYGYYEVRAKLGTGKVDSTIDQGWHHSFWAMASVIEGDSVGTTYPGLRRTEIDCFENSNNLNEFTQHVIIWKPNGKEYGRRPVPPADHTVIEGYEASDWHVYGFDWSPEKIVFYVDGQVSRIGEYPAAQFTHDDINVWLSAMSANWCSKHQKNSVAYYDYFRFYTRNPNK